MVAALALSAGGSIAAGVASTLAGATVVGSAAGMTAIVNCQHTAVIKPVSFIIACADANSYLQQMTWTSWGARTATAAGTYTANSCTPYCAAGKFVNHKATVSLSAMKTVNGKRYFTLLHVSYLSGVTTKSFNFQLQT